CPVFSIFKLIFTFCNRIKKLHMLLFIRIGIALFGVSIKLIPVSTPQNGIITGRKIDAPFCALKRFINPVGRPFKMAALTVDHGSVGIGQFHRMVVIYFTVFFTGTPCTATGALYGNGVTSLYPIGHVDIVHMLLNNMVTAEPVEVIPVAHL